MATTLWRQLDTPFILDTEPHHDQRERYPPAGRRANAAGEGIDIAMDISTAIATAPDTIAAATVMAG